MKSKSVLGITFTEETLPSVLIQCKQAWQNQSRLRIATVNPEFLVASAKNSSLHNNLEASNIRVVDGFGLWTGLRLQGWHGPRITGVELVEVLLPIAEETKKSILIVLKKGGLSSLALTKDYFSRSYPKLNVNVLYEDELTHPEECKYDCAFIATGIPEQEYLGEQFTKGVIIGVGGAIDFLTGMQKRAPELIRDNGLEWLWRFLLQPNRALRIWNAVIIFPVLFVFDKRKS